MLHSSKKSVDRSITDLMDEILTGLNEPEKKKLLKELQYRKAKAEAARLNSGVRKNNISASEIIRVIRKIRIENGWKLS
jgi:hypothetical protein